LAARIPAVTAPGQARTDMIDAPAGPFSVVCQSWRPSVTAKAVSVSPSPRTAIPPPTATYAWPKAGTVPALPASHAPGSGTAQRCATAGGAAPQLRQAACCGCPPETRLVTGKISTTRSTAASRMRRPTGGQRPGSRLRGAGGRLGRPARVRRRFAAVRTAVITCRPAAVRLVSWGRSDNQSIPNGRGLRVPVPPPLAGSRAVSAHR
jgi:hypothetical protein